MTKKSACVFAASQLGNNPAYKTEATLLGEGLGAADFDIVYGGLAIGLMGDVASAAKRNGAKITGILPGEGQKLSHRERLASRRDLRLNDLTRRTHTLEERKYLMLALSDIAVALPGGVGSLDEVVTTVELQRRVKSGALGKLILVSTNHFYEGLKVQLERTCMDGFADPALLRNIYFAKNAADAVDFAKRASI